jgi:hypothetical protein
MKNHKKYTMFRSIASARKHLSTHNNDKTACIKLLKHSSKLAAYVPVPYKGDVAFEKTVMLTLKKTATFFKQEVITRKEWNKLQKNIKD